MAQNPERRQPRMRSTATDSTHSAATKERTRNEEQVKRLGLIAVLAVSLVGFSASAALATGTPTFNAAAAPQGTHVQTGTPSCSFVTGTQNVTCSSFELAGVGNVDATATLTTTYSAIINCTNRGGNLVEVHNQTVTTTTTSGAISPVNGRLTVPTLTSTAPTEAQVLMQASCPNPNWTASVQPGSITLVSSVYTVTFEGFTGAFITIIDP
jgi:hypothetical protein